MRRLTVWCLSSAGLVAIILAFSMLFVAVPTTAQDEGEEPVTSESESDVEETAAPIALEFTGSRDCRDCHRGVYSAFRDTTHSLTLRESTSDDEQEAIVADFAVGDDVRTIQLPGEDSPRPFTEADIVFALGAGRNLQAYLFDGGEDGLIVLPAEWDVANQQWVRLSLADEWPAPAYSFGPQCAGCHTTGLNTEEYTWEESGVQCETCHGPGSAHVEAADEASRRPTDEEIAGIRNAISNGPNPQMCGQCHSRGVAPDGVHAYPIDYLPGTELLDPAVYTLVSPDNSTYWWPTGHAQQQNMQFNEWHSSAHASALDSLRGADKADDTCLTCHSGDYLYNQTILTRVEDGDWSGAPPDPVTLNSASYGITCSTCHNPHSAGEYDHLLVTDSYTLCTSCHANTESLTDIHHPAKEMFEGVTLIAEVAGVAGAHFMAEEGPDCQTCHMPSVPVGATLQRVSHSLGVILPGDVVDIQGLSDGCTTCHTEYLDGAGIQQLVDDVQADTRARLENARAALAADTPQWVSAALDFVAGDGSLGVHNYAYTQALLSASEKALELVPVDTTGLAQITSTREVLQQTREATRTDEVVFGLTLPMLIALGIAVLVLIAALVLLLGRRWLPGGLSLLVVVLVVGAVMLLRSPAETPVITGNNDNCLFCHAGATYQYTFTDGSSLDLRVDPQRLASSVHTAETAGTFGCMDCHEEGLFPHKGISFASRGAYRVEMSSVCINCHLKDTAHYEDVLERNILVGCSDCHTAHYVVPAVQLTPQTIPVPLQ